MLQFLHACPIKRYYRIMSSKFIVNLLPMIFIACAVTDRENDGPVFCTINQTETYQVGTSTAVDFDETNLEKTTDFNSNDCPNVNNDSFTVLISRVKRENTALTVIENQFQLSQFQLDMIVSGTTLLPVKNVININGCSIIQTWRGSIAGNSVTVNEVITYRGACQSTFYNPDFDTTNPGA